MEKRGVIDDNTPQPGGSERAKPGEPHTKEAADKLAAHPANEMIDAVADQTDKNRGR